MPHASASTRTSSLPFLPKSAGRRATATGATFADALTFAFDIAYRAPGSLSLAQRSAYGLDLSIMQPDVVGRAQLGETLRRDVVRRAQLGETSGQNVVGRAQLGDSPPQNVARRAKLGDTPRQNVARRAQLGEAASVDKRSTVKVDRSKGRPLHQRVPYRTPRDPYFRVSARAGGADIAFVVANGRVFAGLRSWKR